MTTAVFVHMVPPYFASGAGARLRRSVGTAMLWGAFGVSLFGIFLTPVFYFVVRRLTDRGLAGAETGGPPVTLGNATEDEARSASHQQSPVKEQTHVKEARG